MTFGTESQRAGRRYVKYFEVDPDECTQEYGVAPCLPTAAFAKDTFTDTNGVKLSAHIGESGPWSVVLGSSLIPEIQSNAVDVSSASSVYWALLDQQAETADNGSSSTFSFTNSGPSTRVHLLARFDSGGLNGYEVVISASGAIQIRKWVSGTPTILTTGVETISDGVDYDIALTAIGTAISLSIDGISVLSTTDSSIVTGNYIGIGAAIGAVAGEKATVDSFASLGDPYTANACFKTRSTCQFSQAYGIGTKTDRFFESTEDALELGLEGYPLLRKKGVKTDPTRLNPGRGIGVRAELTVNLDDTRHHDRGTDPYATSRTYDAMTQGTFWGKWLARNKYYTGRTVRLYDGFLTGAGYSAANFRVREYIITKIDRTKKGVTFKCGDILQKLETAMAPPPSNVYLTGDITDSQTTIGIDTTGEVVFPLVRADGSVEYIEPFAGTLPFYRADGSSSFIPLTVDNELPFYRADGSYDPIPLIATEFPIGDTITVRIGSELITGTVAAGELTGCTRGARGSVAAAHVTGDTVQKCIVLDDDLPTDALTLQFTYAGIQSYINTAGWTEQADKWLGLSLLNGVISTPTKVTKNVERICVQGTVYPWWDDFTQQIELLAIAPQAELSTLPVYTDELNIIEDSVSTEANMREQITQMLVWYDKINEAEDNSANNMALVYPVYDSGAESAEQWDLSRTEQIECEFVKSAGHASAIGNRTLNRLRDGEQVIKFQTDIKEPLKTGGEFVINSDASQNADGSQESVRMQVVEMSELDGGKMYYEAIKSAFQATRYAYIAVNTVSATYTLATDEERIDNAFICNNLGFMADGTEGYKVI
jgi:hypothetical protein